MYCNNCNKYDIHIYKNCPEPKTSYGIICLNNKKTKVLMIQRKHSLAYTEFIRGKYDLLDTNYLEKLIDMMTINEQKKITTNNFKMLWNNLWGIKKNKKTNKINRSSFYKSMLKFNILRNGYYHEKKNMYIDIKNLIKKTNGKYNDPEWFFPKGKREDCEEDLECAKREFIEETNIKLNNIEIISNKTISEAYTSINKNNYKTTFYIGKYSGNKTIIKHSNSEIGSVKWIDILEIKNYFRRYEKHKFKILNKFITENII